MSAYQGDDIESQQPSSTTVTPRTPAENGNGNKKHVTIGSRFSVSALENEGGPVSRKSSFFSNTSPDIEVPEIEVEDVDDEHPPMIDFYRQTKVNNIRQTRPTMTELIHGTIKDNPLQEFEEKNVKIIKSQLKASEQEDTPNSSSEDDDEEKLPPKPIANTKKFGWFEGVFVRCCANTFGVMLYMRMAWVAGQAGIMMGSIIVSLGAVITIITALSMSAICSNGVVRGGGAYYLISRSLGPQFGGAIGIIFSLANAVGAAMCTVGFAENVVQILGTYGISIVDGGVNDIRIIGIITCFLLLAIIFIGLSFEAKMQSVLLAIIIASICNFYLGCLFAPSLEKQQRGMTGFKSETFIENFYPAFRYQYHFFSVFAIYFPAATGIMAGANISGDLKKPTTAIPKGTILGILLTTFVYLSIVWISGATVVRDADGVAVPILLENSTAISNDGWWISSIFSSVFGNGTQYYAKPDCAFDNVKKCQYGIVNDSQIFSLVSWWSPLVIAGVLTSTLSSALLSLVSAPKIFQSVAQDKLFPYIGYFASGFKKTNTEPQKAYIFAFLLCCAVVLVGNLNAIASVISNFYLSTYALINFACFDNSFANSPGFRPSFKYYHKWISLLGAILCVCVMFIISYQNALITFMFFGLLFFYMAHRKPDVNWGSSKQAHAYRRAFQYCQRLEKINEHVKNYRPQILVLSGNPASRPSLVDFAHAITKGNSLLVCGHVIPHEMDGSVNTLIQNLSKQIKTWFSNRRLKAFYFPVANIKYRQGIQCLLQGSGLGKLKPNILFMGYKQNWDHKSALKEIDDYFGIILDAFNSQMGVCILRNGKDGFDFSNLMLANEKPIFYEDKNYVKKTAANVVKKGTKLMTPRQHPQPMKPSFADSLDALTLFSDGGSDFNICRNAKNMEKLTKEFGSEQVELLTTINVFRLKIEKGVIDIWWLYDDGGLSLLIPYLLTQTKSYLEGSKLRIFTLASNTANVEEDKEKLEEMLLKFRIEYDEIIVVKDDGQKPKPETIHEFERLIGPFYVENDTFQEIQEGMISKTELQTNETKTLKMLKIAEYLRSYSAESNLIVITLPVPKKELIGGCLYMAWLEIMTKNLPPSLFIRGNQTSVLTLYS